MELKAQKVEINTQNIAYYESSGKGQTIFLVHGNSSSCTLPYSQKSQPLVFGVYLSPESLPIGYVLLKGFNMDLLTAETAVAILDKKYRNKGYGKLALKRVIIYAFDELGIKTIGATILLSNKSSINMVKNLGFVVTEIKNKSWPMPNGELADMVFMELKNDSTTSFVQQSHSDSQTLKLY